MQSVEVAVVQQVVYWLTKNKAQVKVTRQPFSIQKKKKNLNYRQVPFNNLLKQILKINKISRKNFLSCRSEMTLNFTYHNLCMVSRCLRVAAHLGQVRPILMTQNASLHFHRKHPKLPMKRFKLPISMPDSSNRSSKQQVPRYIHMPGMCRTKEEFFYPLSCPCSFCINC